MQASHLTAPVEKRLGKRLRQQEHEDIGTSPHTKRSSSQSHQASPTAGHLCAAAVARSSRCCCRLLLCASSHDMLHMQRHSAAMRSPGELKPSKLHPSLASQQLLREAYQSATKRNSRRRQKTRADPMQVLHLEMCLSRLEIRFSLAVSFSHVVIRPPVFHPWSLTLMKWFCDYSQCQDSGDTWRADSRDLPLHARRGGWENALSFGWSCIGHL